MVDQPDDDLGIDMQSYVQQGDDDLEDSFIDMESYQEQTKDEPTWGQKIGDVFVQAGLGALKLFTWPADVLKLGMLGEGLSDLDELEEAHAKAGKPFDREKYIQTVFQQAQYAPTQELAEKGFEEVTGLSLQPKSEWGKAAKQAGSIAAFTPGGAVKKLASSALGVGTTETLKATGVGEGKAELIGDLASAGPALLQKAPKALSKAATEQEKTARKYALPFMEFMVKEREPALKGRLFRTAETQLKDRFNLSAEQAMKRIVENELPLARLRERGVNLDALGEHAYTQTRRLAQAKNKPIKTNEIVKNIEAEIQHMESLAPSPSQAQKAAIKMLQEERDLLSVSNPTADQLINQHMNYNANMKGIYRKPEFSGSEEQIRKTNEFLKQQLVTAMEKQGSSDVANALRAANKIHHEKSKLAQTEGLLEKAFDGSTYNPKKLDRLLNSKQGKFLKRNLGKDAVRDLQEIADYGKKAQERMAAFLDLRGPAIEGAVRSWGELAPFVFLPHNLQGTLLAMAGPVAARVQGVLLTRPATREVYKLALKHAAEGAFNLLKRDMAKLEREISREWGTVDDFMDAMLSDLELLEWE